MSASSSRRTIDDILAPLDIGSFDWQAYEGTYQGRALITRLSHIPHLLLGPSSRPSPTSVPHQLAKEAIQRLIPHLKTETLDHPLYLQLLSQIRPRHTSDEFLMHLDGSAASGSAGADVAMASGTEENGVPDLQWVEEAREEERKESSRLDVELRGYLSNLIKESIRLTYLAFAQLSVKVGNAQSAMKNFGAAREYSTSPQHHVDLGVGIIETLLAFNVPASLPGHISKLEATLDRLHPPPTRQIQGTEAANVTASDIRERRANEARSAAVRRSVVLRIRVGKGLVALFNREWSRAAAQLGAIAEEEGGLAEFEGKAISSSDIALIVAFCTLASASRETIRSELLDRASFKAQVEDHDAWIIELLRAFVDARYGEVMKYLLKAEPILLLNPFLSSHTNILIDIIQTRCIKQYVLPFSSIQIQTMAQSFGLIGTQMLGLVEALVASGDIKGKIDLIDRVLSLSEPDWRGDMFQEAFNVGKKSTDMTQVALLRMRLIEAGIIVDPRGKASDRVSASASAGQAQGQVPSENENEKGTANEDENEGEDLAQVIAEGHHLQLALDEGLGEGLGFEASEFKVEGER
ncbi:hypothetical protein I316_04801 [Kwoniella heveanensis BCC8398]|uniref:PCI domain-containing protein n=1 Tax=Kwoniella heveanensis BCC8398 TaxID=1296120 RepID=A0A1B9GQP4_9TREE|nr:hypothetical protein I316_04801 [Kwoniella heveanensis BCC8398]